ncbi:hypothetical protein TcasGA2_TC032211 [Tribolium castaneum]|uniref:Uncharacterized protein n=1 Tax=Tribolium castaneum TaxID=7070 RepID=A0A139WN45_TRICA|nr:hypothetical protein TcasGA2_TC032211 [Tribolium castaneum]
MPFHRSLASSPKSPIPAAQLSAAGRVEPACSALFSSVTLGLVVALGVCAIDRRRSSCMPERARWAPGPSTPSCCNATHPLMHFCRKAQIAQ